MFLQKLPPCLETDSEIHEGEEWINCVRATRANFLEEFILHIELDLAFLLDEFHCQVEQLVLSDKLSDLHVFVQIKFTVLVAHYSIEKLVEIYPAVL